MTPFPTLTSHKIRALAKMRLNVNSSEEANVNWPKNSRSYIHPLGSGDPVPSRGFQLHARADT